MNRKPPKRKPSGRKECLFCIYTGAERARMRSSRCRLWRACVEKGSEKGSRRGPEKGYREELRRGALQSRDRGRVEDTQVAFNSCSALYTARWLFTVWLPALFCFSRRIEAFSSDPVFYFFLFLFLPDSRVTAGTPWAANVTLMPPSLLLPPS